MPTIGVSFAVPEPWAAQLQEARRRAGDDLADAVPPHVTLMPPTQLEEADRDVLLHHLASVAARHSPFRMTLRGTGTFRPTSEVVFVAVAEGISNCEQIEAQVRSGPVARTLLFPYHPHVTIAHDVPEEGLDRAFNELAGFEARFQVEGFDLYEHGADEVWRPVRHFSFAGTPAARGVPVSAGK
ncbi:MULTISPECIES: 2'-5' RNA ligase family protein [Allobranchiibius]|uniref:2'-5' RNA ligase n=1 Tax=Allobranchiibius huperziae TaxID=1874116 RepID=A0A853DHK8_9MICO|nr:MULTISPECIES: 2'-5' RNA ligase family protein [Allobranchiibius]NYJ75503.1 2'-5' RNA ligase [Allobranchiibius huperziae]UIJ36316.1 2'-5' RNA ligase family protein [Allobranchiibius sp. GilTou73]